MVATTLLVVSGLNVSSSQPSEVDVNIGGGASEVRAHTPATLSSNTSGTL